MWTYRIIYSVFLLSAAPAVLGQQLLTVDEAVARAVASHPLLEAGTQQIAVSEGLRRQAGLAPNPSVILQHENIRSAPAAIPYWTFTDMFAYVEQRFETAGKRRRRVESASAGVERAALEKELLAKQLAGRVKQAYWAAAGAQRIYELLLEAARNFLLIVEYHEVRVREGAMAEADLLRIRLESERLNLAAKTAYLESERARIDLFREMGVEDIPDAVRFEALDLPPGGPVVADSERALTERTEMKLARLAIRQAEMELRLAQANAKPDVTALAGYKRTAGYNTLLAGVRFDLPFSDRNQGNVAAASARIAAAKAELAAATAMVRAEVAAAAKAVSIRRRQIIESLEPMRKEAMESSEIARAAYREGGWDLLRLLDAERLRIEVETLYFRALAEYRQSLAELETAMGVAP